MRGEEVLVRAVVAVAVAALTIVPAASADASTMPPVQPADDTEVADDGDRGLPDRLDASVRALDPPQILPEPSGILPEPSPPILDGAPGPFPVAPDPDALGDLGRRPEPWDRASPDPLDHDREARTFAARDDPRRQGSERAFTGTSTPEVRSPLLDVAVLLPASTVALTGLALIWLYRRIRRDRALENDLRASIVDHIKEVPGATLSDLADALDVARQTVAYHVRVLDELDILTTDRDGKYVRLYVEGEHDRRVRGLLAALRRQGRRDVLHVLRDEPELRLVDIASRLGCHRSTVKHHADALQDDGLIQTLEGSDRRFEIPETVMEQWDRLTDGGPAESGRAA